MKIKVNNEFLEGNSVIGATYAANDIGNVSNRQGTSSNNFTFPMTNFNRGVLGFPEDINITNRNPYRKLSAVLFDGSIPISTGYLKINSVTLTQINCTYFAENTDWFSDIKEKKMQDLNLEDLDHDYTRANIVASITATEGYIYPIIDYGLFSDRANLQAEVSELFPAVYVKTLMDQIFTDIGWTIDGELIDLPIYNRMILPFAKEDFTHSEGFIEDNTLTISRSSSQLMVDGDKISFDGVGEDVFPNESGNYTGKITIYVQSKGNPLVSYNFILRKNDTTILYSTGLQVATDYTFEIQLDEFELLDTDFLSIDVFLTGIGTPQEITIAPTIELELTPTNEIIEGNEIVMSTIMPDMKQVDFIQYIFNLFGVIPIANVNKKEVMLYLHKNIKGRLDSALDWSSKIDISNTYELNFTELISDYGQVSEFKYLEDEDDPELTAYRSQNGKVFGSGELLLDNQHISRRTVLYKAPFQPMINVVSFNQQLYVPQIALYNDAGEKEFNPKPRVALVLPNQDVTDLTGGVLNSFGIIGSDATTGSNQIPFCWFVKAPFNNDIDEIEESLAFGDIPFTTVAEGTLEKFWFNYKKELENIKYVNARMSLNAVDINSNPLVTPVYIDYFKAYFRVNKIKDYTGSDELTDVELVKIN